MAFHTLWSILKLLDLLSHYTINSYCATRVRSSMKKIGCDFNHFSLHFADSRKHIRMKRICVRCFFINFAKQFKQLCFLEINSSRNMAMFPIKITLNKENNLVAFTFISKITIHKFKYNCIIYKKWTFKNVLCLFKKYCLRKDFNKLS